MTVGSMIRRARNDAAYRAASRRATKIAKAAAWQIRRQSELDNQPVGGLERLNYRADQYERLLSTSVKIVLSFVALRGAYRELRSTPGATA
ncbi:hypothetical protein EOL96_03575 [Candidatus Saccharibacteria bacterium]|nr:hypothetical protein [Candidatus Saccharibacteria bacterium]